jgi:Domain of unknown function (DUF6901)
MCTEILKYHYKFKFPSESTKEFILNIEKSGLKYINSWQGVLPNWTFLDFHKCKECTLNQTEHKHCPAAANLHPIMEFFKDSNSYDRVQVVLETADRIYSKHTSLQQGVSSMIGIIMTTSGCPILSQLKPMTRFHLPFANPQETLYRAISMYLMKQYFKLKKGIPADWEMKNLSKIYDNIHNVNISFAKRLTSMENKDADINSLIILDNLANYVNFSLDREKLSNIEDMFEF